MSPQDEADQDEKACPGCGAPEHLWSGPEARGYISKTGELHCCLACARGEVCSCNLEQTESGQKIRHG